MLPKEPLRPKLKYLQLQSLHQELMHQIQPDMNLKVLLLPEIQKTLQEAIDSGGSTLRDYRQVSGELGYFQHRFFVYDREAGACQRPQCGGTIERLQQSGRSTFFCPHCQRRK